MIPQRLDVTALVLQLLGDTSTTGGGIFTSAFQAPFLNASFQELVSRLSAASGDKVQKEAYYVLPSNTGALAPVTAGLSNFGFPEEIRERSITGTYAISAVTPNSPSAGLCTVTLSQALPSSVTSGALLEVYGVVGISEDINSQWSVTVNSPTSIVLNGCTATGTYVSGGTVVFSSIDWSDPLDVHDTTDLFPLTVSSALGMYSWQRSMLRFPPCATSRELKITFNLSGSLPVISSPVTTDSMVIDDSLNFLAHRTAQLCAASKGNPREQRLMNQADYFLGVVLAGAARALQMDEAIVPRPFRGKRNIRQIAW
jgi:hypothetical protein